MRPHTYQSTLAVVCLAVVIGLALGCRSDWRICSSCGMQEYERACFGVVIESLCERGYDEWGTAAAWRQAHGRMCEHAWRPPTAALCHTFRTLAAEPRPINLAAMPHLSAKGRVQDRSYNPDVPLVEQLLAMGPAAIPLLISMLDDETHVHHQVLCLWPGNTVGDIALVILHDLVTTGDGTATTIPGADYNTLLGARPPTTPFFTHLYAWVAAHGRTALQQRWQHLWEAWAQQICWDADERCFRLCPG
jgi:hypothetical protein